MKGFTIIITLSTNQRNSNRFLLFIFDLIFMQMRMCIIRTCIRVVAAAHNSITRPSTDTRLDSSSIV